MINKRKKRYALMCVMVCLAVLLTGIATTLAVLRDSYTTNKSIVFHKVAIAGESEEGSSLHIELANNMVSNGTEIINTEKTGEGYLKNLYFKQAGDSADMFVRFKAYFTFGDPKTDLKTEESYILSLLNKEKGAPNGFIPYENIDYEYVLYGDWYYLVSLDDTIENAEDKILKAVTEEQNTFTISNYYKLSYPNENEVEILKCVQKHEGIELKVEVQAIQCEGLGNILEEVEDKAEENEVLISEENANIPKVKVKAFEIAYNETREASKININFDSNLQGLKDYLTSSSANVENIEEVAVSGDMKSMAVYKDEWFELPVGSYNYTDADGKVYATNGWLTEDGKKINLNSNFDILQKYSENGVLTLSANWEEVAVLKVESSAANTVGSVSRLTTLKKATMLGTSYMRVNVYSIDFVGDENFVADASFGDPIDVGTIPGKVMMYVKERDDGYLDVIIHQKGGVRLNPNSYALFANLGYSAPMEKLNLSEFDIDLSLITDTSYMFSNLGRAALKELKLINNFNMSNVTNMMYMFNNTGYNYLVSLQLGNNFDTSNVTNMNSMFQKCGYNSMTSLDLGNNFDTSNVTDMNSMFDNCGRSAMTTLNLGANFNTSKVTTMEYMFYNCGRSAMTTLSLGDKFDTSNVTNMDNMFNSCGSNAMEYIDFGNFMLDNLDSEGNLLDESKPTSYTNIFRGTGLSGCKINVANNLVGDWIMSQDNTFYYMPPNETGKAYLNMTSTEKEETSGFLGSLERNENYTRKNIITLTFKDSKKINMETIIGDRTYEVIPCGFIGNEITDLIKAYWIENDTGTGYDVYVIQEDGVILNPNSSYLFSHVGRVNMVKLDMTDWDIDTSLVKDMSYMFYYCGYSSMEEFRLAPNFNTDKVKNMEYMFNNCGGWKCAHISLGGMMENMVNEDGSIKEECVLTSTYYTFKDMGHVSAEIITKNTAVQNWVKPLLKDRYITIQNLSGNAYLAYCGYEDPSPGTNIFKYVGMFRSDNVYSNLKRVNVRTITLIDSKNFNIESEISSRGGNVNYYVVNCGFINDQITDDIKAYWIEGSYIDSFDRTSVCYDVYIAQEGGVVLNPNSSYLFANVAVNECSIGLDMTNWDINTELVTNMSNMFMRSWVSPQRNFNVTKFIISDDFDTSNVTDMYSMFVNVDIPNATIFSLGNSFNTENVTNMSFMFDSLNISNVQDFTLGEKFDTKNVTDMSFMFSGANMNLIECFDFGSQFMVNNFNEDGTLTHEINTKNMFNEMVGEMTVQCANDIIREWIKSIDNGFKWELIPNETNKSYLVSTKYETSKYSSFLGSAKVNSKLIRANISYLTFTSYYPEVEEGIQNAVDGTYYIVDCGYLGTEINGDIKAYWVLNDEQKYNVYVYQENKVILNPDSSYLLSGLTLDYVLGNWHLDISLVTDMSYMFYYSVIDTVSFSGKDTSNVTNMSHMFSNAKIGTINFTNSFNTISVKDMSYMFNEFRLKEDGEFVLGPNFNTSNVENMEGMFYNHPQVYTNILSLDLGDNFYTTKVTNMKYMFNYFYDPKMTSIDLGRFMMDNLNDSGNLYHSALISGSEDMFLGSFKYNTEVIVAAEKVKTWIVNNEDRLGGPRWMDYITIVE